MTAADAGAHSAGLTAAKMFTSTMLNIFSFYYARYI
jgi:hypothetical protein